MLIGEPKEVYVYADGKRTNELEAIGYPVISTRQWEKFMVKVKETVPSVEFNGKAHKLIAVPDDFFTNLESAMPGDILKDAVQIANTTDQEAELFFQTNTDGRSEE